MLVGRIKTTKLHTTKKLRDYVNVVVSIRAEKNTQPHSTTEE